MKLEHSFTVAAPRAKVWSFLMNVPEMAACIPGTSDVKAVDAQNYDATVSAKIGPISARFGCRIAIETLDEAAGTGEIALSGKDSKLGGGIRATMKMSLSEAGGETTVSIHSDVDIMGKIGQYGHGMISKRADAMLADFAACARAKLA